MTSVTIGKNVEYINPSTFSSCPLVNVMVKNIATYMYDNAFSDRTYQHAMLYIPDGEWVNVVYHTKWYVFNHIKEVVTNDESLAPTMAYNLMDANTFGYMVYDPASNSVKNIQAFYKLDDGNPNNCWQVIENNGGKCLYNIGAHKYARMMSDGSITMSELPVAYKMDNTDDGIKIGNSNQNWGFVKDATVEADKELSGIGVLTLDDTGNKSYYTLDGQRVNQPKKGVNIVKMSGKNVKVVVK